MEVAQRVRMFASKLREGLEGSLENVQSSSIKWGKSEGVIDPGECVEIRLTVEVRVRIGEPFDKKDRGV